jgi:hypothetical protein
MKEDQQDFLAVQNMKQIVGGFALQFTQPVDPATAAQAKVKRHTYRYHAAYGSPKIDEKEVACEGLVLDGKGTAGLLKLAELIEGYVYTIELLGLKSAQGKPLLGDKIHYTLLKTR